MGGGFKLDSRRDCMEAVTCGWLSLVVVVTLTAQWLMGAWWMTPYLLAIESAVGGSAREL
jgi:hypothetical protein